MTIDPAVVVGAILGLSGLLGFFLRAFATGAILPRSTVPREDYDALLVTVKEYAARFGEQSSSVDRLAKAVEKLAGPS